MSFMALLEDGKAELSDSIDIEGGRTKYYDQEMVDASRPNAAISNTARML